MTVEEAAAQLTHVPEVQAVEVARLNPGDVVVISCDVPVSGDMAQRINDYLQQIWPNNKIVVLDRGVTMKVVRAEDVKS